MHLPNVFVPARFQGAGRRRSYFEGYYFKIVDPQHHLAVAFIPGVSYDEHGLGHAFIQVIDGVAHEAAYHRYALDDFAAHAPHAASFDADRAAYIDSPFGDGSAFQLEIGESSFSESGIVVRVPGVQAACGFRQNLRWPWRPWSPGAMGPFSFVPGMQCKHGILSLHHLVTGTISLEATATAPTRHFTLSDEAVGYLEKDWGSSFPRRWTWLQSNHFSGVDGPCCLTVSRGVVPWVTGAFEGFIVGLLWPGGFVRFTTYNGSSCRQNVHGTQLHLECTRGTERLNITTEVPSEGAGLAAPQAIGGMSGKVNESLTARATIVYTRGSQTLLKTEAHYLGAELGGVE